MKTKLLKHASEIFKESDIVVGDMDKKIAILFANYDSMGYLGQPVLNDCEEFAKRLAIDYKYKCYFICNAQCSTAKAIIKKLIEMRGKQIVFFYSGHGTQIPDKDGDEADGKDEAFCFRGSCLVDDDFCHLINEYLDCERLICITDACHSGSIYDAHRIRRNIQDRITCISSCDDHETSKQLLKNGVFTYNFWNNFDMKTKMLNTKIMNKRLSFFDQHLIMVPAGNQFIDF